MDSTIHAQRPAQTAFQHNSSRTLIAVADRNLAPPRTKCLPLKAKIAAALKIDFDDMFESSQTTHIAESAKRRVFLAYHPQNHLEHLEILTRWLMMGHVEVINAWHEGSWDYFKRQVYKSRSGTIIVHPDFDHFIELPEIGKVLQNQVRVWSVGIQEGIEYDSALTQIPPVLRQDCIEVFPVGGFVYMTDEVFETKPQLALKIIKLFFAKIEKLKQVAGPISPWQQVNDACILWRLCVRPELMEYLLHHCEAHADELDNGDPAVWSRAELYRILAETNYIEQDNPVTALSLQNDKFPILSERRIIAEEEPLDYFNTLARSQQEANLHMIHWYASMQVDLRRDYRHFYVVHTEPEAPYVQDWKDQIQTIAEVITPERCVEEFGKSGDASLFDFQERYMPEHALGDWKNLKSAIDEGETTQA
ncbi:hypothetical protein ACN47E_007015 [Coniothyrium glycines]